MLTFIMNQRYLASRSMANFRNLLKKAIYFLAIFCFEFCKSDKNMTVREKVAERITSFREKKMRECNVSLFNEAEKIVDSILLSEAMMELNDSLIRLRPIKPSKPDPLQPLDSLLVAPIFKSASPSSKNQ